MLDYYFFPFSNLGVSIILFSGVIALNVHKNRVLETQPVPRTLVHVEFNPELTCEKAIALWIRHEMKQPQGHAGV